MDTGQNMERGTTTPPRQSPLAFILVRRPSIFLIFFGIIFIILQIIITIVYYSSNDLLIYSLFSGFWGGFFFIITGIFGIFANKKNDLCLLFLFFITTLASAVLSLGAIIFIGVPSVTTVKRVHDAFGGIYLANAILSLLSSFWGFLASFVSCFRQCCGNCCRDCYEECCGDCFDDCICCGCKCTTVSDESEIQERPPTIAQIETPVHVMTKLEQRKLQQKVSGPADLVLSENLTAPEKMVFAEIRKGDNDATISLLKNPNVEVDLNKRDFYGRTILSYAVLRNNEELIDFMTGNEFPAHRKPVYIGDCLAYAIEDRNYSIAEKILNYAEYMGWLERQDKFETKKSRKNFESVKTGSYCFVHQDSFGPIKENVSVKFTDDVLRNPIIQASIMDDYPLIQLLYGKGFRVTIDGDPEDEKPIPRLNRFRALCSPSYLSVNELDAIEVCFKNSGLLDSLADNDPVYSVEYRRLASQVRNYAVQLLSECRNEKEIKMILTKFNEQKNYIDSDFGVFKYPRLEEAIKYEQKEFIAHPHCQKVINEMWSSRGVTKMSFGRIFVSFLIQILLVPISTLYLLFIVDRASSIRKVYPHIKKSKSEDSIIPDEWKKFVKIFLKSPFSIALRYYGTFLVFLILLAVEVFRPTQKIRPMMTYGCNLDALEVVIMIFIFGYMKHVWMKIYNYGRVFFYKLENISYMFWVTCAFLSYVVWGIGFLRSNNNCDESKVTPRYQWTEKQGYIVASEIFFMIAVIGSFLKILEICQINHYLGIMQYILYQTFKDTMYILGMFCLFILCFALGLHLLYFNYTTGNWQIENNELSGLPECKQMEGEFSNFKTTIKTLTWDLFGYGNTGLLDIMQPNIRHKNGTLLDPTKMEEMRELLCYPYLNKEEWNNISDREDLRQTFEPNLSEATEFFGYGIVFVYHLISIVLLLNLLIAKMSQTYSKISDNADKEWKFQRTIYLTGFMDLYESIPPPFNLIPRVQQIKELFEDCGVKTNHIERGLSETNGSIGPNGSKNKEYYEFEDLLHQRLLQKQLEEAGNSDDLVEMTKELLQNTNSLLGLADRQADRHTGTPMV